MRKFITYMLLLIVCMPGMAQNEINREPEFEGGQAQMVEYLRKNVVYPEELKKEGVSGTVLVSIVVKKDGTVSKAKVTQKLHPQLDKEAIRVVKTMPTWIPGAKNGKKANMPYTVPVSFTSVSSLVGMWQMIVPVTSDNGQQSIKAIPIFKLLNADGTFQGLRMVPNSGAIIISMEGTFKQISDNTYVENVKTSISNPDSGGKEFEISYKMPDPNVLIISYPLLNSDKRGEESFIRVIQPDPSQLIKE